MSGFKPNTAVWCSATMEPYIPPLETPAPKEDLFDKELLANMSESATGREILEWHISARLVAELSPKIAEFTEQAVDITRQTMTEEFQQSYEAQKKLHAADVVVLQNLARDDIELLKQEHREGLAQIRTLLLSGKIATALEHPMFNM